MKKVIKKSAIKKKQDGATMLDQVNIDPVRAQQMARNRKVNDYVLKKSQLVKDQAEFSKTLPEQIGGNRPLTVDELNKKNKFKSDINAYGDSIQMTRKRLTPEQLKAEYEKGRVAGIKRKDKEGSGSDINYKPNTLKEARAIDYRLDEEGLAKGEKCKSGVQGRRCQEAKATDKPKKSGGIMKKAQSGTKASKDSTAYFKEKQSMKKDMSDALFSTGQPKKGYEQLKQSHRASESVERQSKKGKPGYDQHGYPTKKAQSGTKVAKSGTSVPKAKDGKWIQKAVNPAHKGYCTPMTKSTCTKKRKALALTFKAMAKKRKK